MNSLVIYHADCTDGFAAAFAAWLKLGDEAEYVAVQYNTPEHANVSLLSPEGRDVYVLDFSFPKLGMDLLFAVAKRVVWLDHHKSAFEMWCDKYYKGMEYSDHEVSGCNYIELSDNASGCILAWEYFHPGAEVPLILRHIDDRDRWQWRMNGTGEIHAALSSYRPWNFTQWSQHFLVEGIRFNALIDEGRSILRTQRQHIEQMMKQARACNVSHYRGFACNSQLHASELGHELANKSGTFGLVWYLSGDNRVKCSFRSNGDYDVSVIAKAFGGGGHKNAAGCEVSLDTLLEWLK